VIVIDFHVEIKDTTIHHLNFDALSAELEIFIDGLYGVLGSLSLCECDIGHAIISSELVPWNFYV
jgi:hypothetical protein